MKNTNSEINQITEHFNINEFRCNDYWKTKVPEHYLQNVYYLAVQLQKIRDVLELDMLRITSGYRTPEHNKNIKGAINSYHTKAMAVDMVQITYTNDDFYYLIKRLIDLQIIPQGELLKYDSWVHYAPRFELSHYPIAEQDLAGNKFSYDKQKTKNIIKQRKFNEHSGRKLKKI